MTQSERTESGCRSMSRDQGLSIFDEPESADDAAEATQVLPVTPKDQPKPETHPVRPGGARR